ncbi:hypothetical protein RDT67_14825 [Serratia fonticola]|uniref:Uncharacterized protein n=1 Tax=Serratia fonticola TaxID=47917 RepID=A0AAJ1YG92_SERFO|nr:hypothetical protein [Serratia fonticola]MDQ9127700.1 hypothetical protein [Serratia fonticola]
MSISQSNCVTNIDRKSILGHDSAWKISNFGVAQFMHNYDPELLAKIKEKALNLKKDFAIHKHLDLTFITGADRYIPEINQLINNSKRLDDISKLIGMKMESYPLSIVSSTITFMSSADGAADWHSYGVAVTELIPLSISEQIQGGNLEIYNGITEEGKAILESGEVITSNKIIGLDHKCGYSTLGQFIGILHRTAPISIGERVTLVLNLRSQEKSFIDDNRMFYLAADNDLNSDWVHELKQDVWNNQLPAYRKYMHKPDEIGKADLI